MSRTNIYEKSFYDKCVELSRQDLLDRWDYDLNDRTPTNIGCKSKFKVFLKCPRGLHESEGFSAVGTFENTLNGSSPRYCTKCRSLAQWGIDKFGDSFLKTFWDYKKNIISPWEIGAASTKKVWIKCDKTNYHGSYLRTPNDLKYGHYCPMCAHQDIIHPYDSLAISNPEVIPLWSEKNIKSAYMYSPASTQSVWWKCENAIHEDYKRKIHNSAYNAEFKCPKCAQESYMSKLEKKVDAFLKTTGYTIFREWNCSITPINPKSGRKMFFDFEIRELKILIEVHGQQHYQNKDWFTKGLPKEEKDKMFEEAQERDRYKKAYALSHGYNYLEIPYHAINSKSNKYIKMIQEAILSAQKAVFA